ncbi:MAG: antitoxin VapB family protein [Thermoplasmataceae archaeon]
MEATTISVKKDVKKLLEQVKGSDDWNQILLKLLENYNRTEGKERLKKLREELEEDDLRAIEESHVKFKEGLRL